MVNLCPRCTRLELKKEDIYINIQENEKIHPFQDENERTGRAIILKQCFDANIVPVIVSDNEKLLYYQALHMTQTEHQYGKLLEFFEKEQEKYYENVKDFVILFKEKEQASSFFSEPKEEDLAELASSKQETEKFTKPSEKARTISFLYDYGDARLIQRIPRL